MIRLLCPDAAATRAAGRRLAGLLRAGDVVLLAGDLGAGKTVFAGGIGDGLGVEDPVVSPTFVLVRQYRGFMPMTHADIYRLGSSAEIEDLDLPAEAADGVLVVEWGDAAAQAFADDHLLVRLTVHPDGARSLEFSGTGSWQGRPLQEVAG